MPRKTTKKPTAKKAVTKKAAPKRKAYQTGGATKPMRPRTMQDMPPATGQRMATTRTAASQAAERKRQEMIKRDRAMMEVGNRQRAAAFEAAKKRAYDQATARTQNLRNTPRKLSPAQQRLLDSYNRGMAQQRQQRAMGRPAPQPRPNPRPAPPTFRPYTGPVMGRPATPSNRGQMQQMNQGRAMEMERQRIRQQIAQLQARLRRLGG